MRYVLFILLAACGTKKNTCDACVSDDARELCEDQIDVCNLLGPVGLALRKDCLESAELVCDADAVDSGE